MDAPGQKAKTFCPRCNSTYDKKIIIGLISFALWHIPASVSAQLFLEQGKISLDIQSGTAQTGTIVIDNTSGESDLRVKAYWEDFEYIAPYNGDKKFLSPGTSASSSHAWVNFSPQEFTLPPHGKKKVSYVINPPENIQGGYYGVLFFEKADKTKSPQLGVNIVTRIGTLFFLETHNKVRKSSFKNIAVADHAIKGTLTNEGDVIVIPDGIFYILDQSGVVAARGKIDKKYLPPHQQTDYTARFTDNLASGQYTMILTIDLQEGRSLVKEIDFTKKENSQYEIIAIRD